MADKFVSKRNLDFMLKDVFDVESLTKFPYFQDHSAETIQMTVDTALKIAANMMYPVFSDMDKQHPEWIDGHVKVNPIVRDYMREMGQGGWMNAELPYEDGGQQLPITVKKVTNYIMAAANYSLAAYPWLTTGAAHLIHAFGTQEMKDTYVEKMYAGEWQGTMALTEPDVGSSLGDLTTSADETDEGYYLIKGKKIFISGADHDGADNVVNLLLARIKGASAGVKGISLFIVPQKRISETGALEDNDVQCGGIELKMGYRGCPISQLLLGEEKNCRGYLIGEPGKGLDYMFQMMNGERMNVGMAAAGQTTAAYYASLEYAQQRLQGRKLNDKNPELPMVPIIEHPDVKRMLLFQRAIAEGSLSLSMQLCMYQDWISVGENAENYKLLLDFLVPIMKSYPAEMGILSTSAGIQILGGYGFCSDFPLEQYYRDIRIHSIHEGTTGIQGQDILGRKVTMKQGKAYGLFIDEVKSIIDQAKQYSSLNDHTKDLQAMLELLQNVTAKLLKVKETGTREEFLADSVLYLEFISILTIGWQWLKQAMVAAKALENKNEEDKIFYKSKLYTCRYFFEYELIKMQSLAVRLCSNKRVTVDMPKNYFV